MKSGIVHVLPVGASYLVSQNRHFLERLKTDAFAVVDAGEFLKILTQKVENDE